MNDEWWLTNMTNDSFALANLPYWYISFVLRGRSIHRMLLTSGSKSWWWIPSTRLGASTAVLPSNGSPLGASLNGINWPPFTYMNGWCLTMVGRIPGNLYTYPTFGKGKPSWKICFSPIHLRRLTNRTWKSWFGSDVFPLKAVYSQVNHVNLPGRNHGSVENYPQMKGNWYWRYTHFPLNLWEEG